MNSRHSIFLLAILVLSTTLQTFSQQKVYYVGHSLVNLDIPYQVSKIQDSASVSNDYRHHINIGSPLKSNWNDTLFNSNPVWSPTLMRNIEYGTNHLRELLNPYDYLVLTEAVPLRNYPVDTVEKYLKKFIDLAKTGNPAIKKFLYATWEGNSANGALWRNRLDTLQPIWENIADQTRISTGGDSVFIIPGNLAMMQLYDELQAGPIGTYTSISQFFQPDGIHLTHEGNYLIACLMSAVVYHTDPVGQDTIKAGPYTANYCITDNIARQRIQEIAMEVACRYSRSGYTGSYCNTASIKQLTKITENISVFPNPSTGLVNVKTEYPIESIEVNDLSGKSVYKSSKNEQKIDLSFFKKGMYLVQINTTHSSKTIKIILN